MADRLTPKQRHLCMSHNKSRNTGPEKLVRQFLWRRGYRYRLHCNRLPGRPDIILRRYHTVIQINGCFWHGHDCRLWRQPQTNAEFWQKKIERNRERDLENGIKLRQMGWFVITIWECDLSKAKRDETLHRLDETLRLIGLSLEHAPKRRKKPRKNEDEGYVDGSTIIEGES